MSYDVGYDVGSTSTTFTRGGRAEETNSLPVDAVFTILSDEQRRHFLYYLVDEAGGEARVTDVADYLRTVESAATAEDSDAILVDLHHRHLPKMEAAGLVDYDGEEETVRYHEDPLVEECLARVAARDHGQRP